MQQYNTANSQALALSFNGVNLNPVERDGQIWMTSADLASALGYSSTKSITNLFNANKDEFTSGMTMVIDSVTNGINGSKRKMAVRIFSLRGCHLIALFSRTDIAKSFRKWVLDILDREVGAPVIEQPPAITDADWQRYAQSMTIPEMAQFTGHTQSQVVDALHKVMGSNTHDISFEPVMTAELQEALDQFWGFIGTQNLTNINHSHRRHQIAISIPEVYGLAAQLNWQMPDTSLLYQALRLSTAPRFRVANKVIESKIIRRSIRCWVFIKSFNQTAIAAQ